MTVYLHILVYNVSVVRCSYERCSDVHVLDGRDDVGSFCSPECCVRLDGAV